VMNIASREPSEALEIGSAYHQGRAAVSQGADEEEACLLIHNRFARLIENLGMADAGTYSIYRTWQAKAEACLRAMLEAQRQGLTPCTVTVTEHVETEVVFEFPIADTGWLYTGRIDGIVECSDGLTRIQELKTASQLGEALAGRLQQDFQISGYVRGAEALGHPVEGGLNEVVLKPRLRQGKEETYGEYVDRCVTWLLDHYDEAFDTRLVQKPERALRRFDAHILTIVQWLNWCYRRPERFVRNVGHCQWHYGRECPYVPLCVHGTTPEQMLRFRKKQAPHEELMD
jgi:hypothetical protein